ncbi:aryl-alcohol dehydrogenase-like predicted oxidoreductase [Streptomyces sp. B4I13]|uniref:aldo/keto reductase n=1 Tax=Streptomyces sp. B4I13 TaxID=3042271 RepID=UPI0027844473|nr:aldo/keto reductase [Streptomyces sp. B4I13]MDQ0956471.1 aryl-alcohol dehydrogenase-like predicted oxidoreductase [Streptomyces sp. B4I13]
MTAPATLSTTPLGRSGRPVGVQGLGCMGMSEFYGPSDSAESWETLGRAVELGVTVFDTADNYGHGHNEELVGRFLRGHRDQVVISTKFGLVRRADDPRYRGIDNSPGYLRAAVEGSLRRLGVDTIDLYFVHRLDPGIPVEETVGAMAGLVREGKVRWLGLCEVTGEHLRAAHEIHPIAAVQSEWSLFSRDVETATVPTAAELGVAFMPYSPLGRGFLARAFTSVDELSGDDWRRTMPRFTGKNGRHNTALLAPVKRIAMERGATPGQIALAWLHQRASVHRLTVIPIPGTRRRTRLEENTAAAALELTAEELTELEPIAGQVAGSRHIGLKFDAVAEGGTR